MPRRPPFGERLYRRLLGVYPRAFRDEFGAEMTRLYRDRARAEGAVRLWLALIVDLLRTAPTEQRIMLSQDLRHAFRVWRRTPMLAATAIVTLALGVGGNTAVFSVVHAVMLRPLPYPDTDRLVEVWETSPARKLPQFAVAPLNYKSWVERSQSFTALAASGGVDFSLTGAGDPERVLGASITASMFPAIGLSPMLGRPLRADDERVGSPRVVVLAESMWRERFGADPTVIGRSITLNGESYEIVAVVPQAFRQIGRARMFTSGDPQVFVPARFDWAREDRANHIARVLGRLKPGVPLAHARDEMRSVAAALEQEFPTTNKDWTVRLDAIVDTMVDTRLRTSLLVLLGAVGLVLLIACANVANLLLARASGRRRELAVRTALGAGRARLVRQLLIESVGLAAISGVCGLLVSSLVVAWLPSVLPPTLPRIDEIRVDGAVLGFSLIVSIATGLIFGVAPALGATRLDLMPALAQSGKGSGGSGTGRSGRAPLRQGLVVAQVALATTLLVGAALLAQSFVRLQRVPPGIDADGAMTARITLPGSRYPDSARRAAFHQRLVQTLGVLPQVEAAGVTTEVPFSGRIRPLSMVRAGGSGAAREDWTKTVWHEVSDDYFRAIGAPLVAGRAFGPQDRRESPRVVIVSHTVARTLWPNQHPIGRTLDWANAGTFEVVGVVGDIRDFGQNREVAPGIYLAASQRGPVAVTLVVRVAGGDANAIVPAIRGAVRDIDPAQPIYAVRALREWLDSSTAQPRFMTTLITAFAAMALLLASVGIYGVLSHIVGQRTQEIGIRMAMGAARGQVLRLVLRTGMTAAVTGIALGLVGAVAISHVLASLLFEVRARDPFTFASVAIVLATVALAACAVPALRATRIDPTVALRNE